MIDRRSAGIFNLHLFFVAAEAVGLWGAMAFASPYVPYYTYYSLLAPPAYPICIAACVLVGMRYLSKLEDNPVTLGWVGAARLAARQIGCIACGVFALAVASKDVGLSRIFVTDYLVVASVVLVVVNRYQPLLLVAMFFAKGSKIPMLLMGRAENFPGLQAWLDGQRALGFTPVGLLDYRGGVSEVDHVPVVGSFERIGEAIAATGAKQILVLELPRSTEDLEHLTRACVAHGCRLMIHNNLVLSLDHPLRALVHHGYSFLALHDEPLEDPINRCFKRLFDLAIAVPVVVFVLPPLMLGIRLVQLRTSPGALFFRQERTGRGGRPFRIWKFRTMHENGDGDGRQARRGDDRIYPFGHFLRRSSLDEMPQFLNVLTGDMSVVGPRPHMGLHDEIFSRSAELYRMRFFVRPGITGLAQSRGYRGEMTRPEDIQERIRLDLIYIRSWSVWLDLAIVARTTVQILLPPRTAY